jgi:hypothetical protein
VEVDDKKLKVKPMLSYDLSAIDIVLVIAVVTLTLLLLSRKWIQPRNKSESPTTGQRKLPDKPKVSRENPQEEPSSTQPSTDQLRRNTAD